MKIVVHGGAGEIPSGEKEERKSVLAKAAKLGLSQETPEKAVEKAIRIMEVNPLFNAGYGGSVQWDGKVRLDAALMKSDLSSGGAINVEGIAHPITLANLVRKRTPHTLLQGDGATELGRNFDLESMENAVSKKSEEKWKELKGQLSGLSYREKLSKLKGIKEGKDTVGAIAQKKGDLAAGTSTGGLRRQMKGRVGDSAIIGSGLYCNEKGAVSTTGIGEDIIRVNLARELIYQLEKELDPQVGAEESIDKLNTLTGSRAGLIAIDNSGKVGAAHNTRDMQYATERG